MKTVLRTVLAVLALSLLLTPNAMADEGHGGGGRVRVVPADHVAGSTGGRIVGDWYAENLSRPVPESPFGGSVNLCLDIGRGDRVLVPAGGVVNPDGVIDMACTVRVGRPVVLVLASADCSSAEPDPFFGATAEEQRACVVSILGQQPIRSIEVSVDGRRPTDVFSDRFFEVSPQRDVVFPKNPVFGARSEPATFVAAGWLAQVRGLRLGTHTVETVTTLDDGQAFRFVVRLTVVKGKDAPRT